MEYRKLPHGEERISVIGMGSSVVGEQSQDQIIETVTYAMDHGINYFDLAAGHASVFEAYGKAMEGRRKDVLMQIHFGADAEDPGIFRKIDLLSDFMNSSGIAISN